MITADSDPVKTNVIDTHGAPKVSFTDGSLAFWDFENMIHTYQLLQFHLHTPSEHTFNGKHYDVELHLVHQSFEGNLAVIAVFFDRKAGGNMLNVFLDSMKLAAKTPAV
jgi:carbonic anhydrase